MGIFRKFVFLTCLFFFMTISSSAADGGTNAVTSKALSISINNEVNITVPVPELRSQPGFGSLDHTAIETLGIDYARLHELRKIYCIVNPDHCVVDCEKNPDADECDKDGDGIINKDDSCPDEAEVYDIDGETPVDGVLDGCPTEIGTSDSVDPAENLSAQMSEGGACTLIRSENGFNFIAVLLLSSLLLPLFISRLSAVKIRSRIRRDLKK